MLLTECDSRTANRKADDRSRDISSADARILASCRSRHVDHNRCDNLPGLGDSGCGRDLRGGQRNAFLGHDPIACGRFTSLAGWNVLRIDRAGARRHCDNSGAEKAGEGSHRTEKRRSREKADAPLEAAENSRRSDARAVVSPNLTFNPRESPITKKKPLFCSSTVIISPCLSGR